MANVKIFNKSPKNLSKEEEEGVLSLYSSLADDITKQLGADETTEWKLMVIDEGSGFSVHLRCQSLKVTIVREIYPKRNKLVHALFELGSEIQGTNVNNLVANVSLKLSDIYKLNIIDVAANLDVGGYAWLRKGAWPTDGKYDLEVIANEFEGLLGSKFIRRIEDLTDTELKAFMFTKEFQEYKPIFLNSSWNGSFDPNDPIVRTAMTKGASAAHNQLNPISRPKLTSNEKILDRYIRHQTYLLRYAGGLRNQVLPDLVATEKKLYDSVVQWVAKAKGNRTLTGASGRKWQRDFARVLNNIRQPAWDDASAEISSQLKELAVSEAATGAAIIEGSVPVVLGMQLPPAAQLVGIVNSQPFEGRTLRGWMERTARADVQKMLTAAKIGIVQGQTPTQVARSIIGTQASHYTDGIARKSFKDVESVILTLTNGIQNEAKQALYEENADIIDRELYVATLDVRTTIQCASNDGKTFPRGKGPMPPLHFRCRSLRVPYINPDNLRNRGFDSHTEKQLLQEYSSQFNIPTTQRADLPRGHKGKFDEFARMRGRQMVGQVPAQTTYNEWLKTQSNGFQDQVLGSTRAEMFRNGDITLDKFVARNGDTLTLDELQRKGLKVYDDS